MGGPTSTAAICIPNGYDQNGAVEWIWYLFSNKHLKLWEFLHPNDAFYKKETNFIFV